eukprot:CAMPEP_0195529678 /NCGR_PEP_ID=MMETSP0794_2-20130614/32308_1 /TAXON_ID=515487 /ORGANISM="Stephanopyxis turris, Strain CCMP 815" /LENGTH=200 /DNA_ID=CAMNT_0040661031 /DNA_START=94 /DNA_END=696 /DNA_ORIENTATION=-
MVKLTLFIASLLATSVNAFVAPTSRKSASTSFVVRALPSEAPVQQTDSVGNNIAVKNLLSTVQDTGLLSQVAQVGLLSKAQGAGISLSKLENLISIAPPKLIPEVLALVEAGGPEILPILPKVIEIAPGALPLLATLITVSPGTLSLGGAAALAATAAALAILPHDSVVSIAECTVAVATGGAAAGASFVGSAVLGKITE